MYISSVFLSCAFSDGQILWLENCIDYINAWNHHELTEYDDLVYPSLKIAYHIDHNEILYLHALL